MTERRIRIEINGKDEFWERAFHVEWEDQYGDRKLVRTDPHHFVARREWVTDLERVASETFCRITVAPENPHRRRFMNLLMPQRGGL